ncbi:uncharacterized protein A4U43_C01F30140 [Asparagus officinalis]|uniref:Uncharacterized protein n=1 Tax=Asparagus officinalis TaxID=4686 RepID=A0A5P1FT91_ASPOF|nr:uncharacterized protein A4U43_C01F30140 [Asparagus officinalis]
MPRAEYSPPEALPRPVPPPEVEPCLGNLDILHLIKELLIHKNPMNKITLEGLMEADIRDFHQDLHVTRQPELLHISLLGNSESKDQPPRVEVTSELVTMLQRGLRVSVGLVDSTSVANRRARPHSFPRGQVLMKALRQPHRLFFLRLGRADFFGRDS